jgi:hypothetical protein
MPAGQRRLAVGWRPLPARPSVAAALSALLPRLANPGLGDKPLAQVLRDP